MHSRKIVLVITLVTASCSSSTGGLKTDSGVDTMAVGSGGAGGTPCAPSAVNSATVDAGALWACFEQACASQLAACAAECLCNNAVATALGCSASGGSSTTCFTPVAGAGTNGPSVVTCLLTSMASCGLRPDAGGGDAAREGGAVGDAAAESSGGP